MWNPYVGQGTMRPSLGVENCEPSQSVIDAIGIDIYDGPCSSYPAGMVERTLRSSRRSGPACMTAPRGTG